MKRVVRQFKTVYVGNPADPARAYRHETETVWVNGRRVHHQDNRQGNRDLLGDGRTFLPSLNDWPGPMAEDWFEEDIPFPCGTQIPVGESSRFTVTVNT